MEVISAVFSLGSLVALVVIFGQMFLATKITSKTGNQRTDKIVYLSTFAMIGISSSLAFSGLGVFWSAMLMLGAVVNIFLLMTIYLQTDKLR